MIGNGPYSLEGSRTDEEIVLVKNDTWTGDINGETWPDRLDKITFLTQTDPDTAYNALAAGEADTANIPPAQVDDAQENWGTTLDVEILGTYYFDFNDRDPSIGGEENLLLRQAISQGHRPRGDQRRRLQRLRVAWRPASRLPASPGTRKGSASTATYDPEGAQARSTSGPPPAASQAAPLKIQFNADAGHEDVVAIIIENLAAIGIQAEGDPRPSETYFTDIADGQCVVLPLRLVRRLPDVRQLHVRPVPHRLARRQQPRLQQPGVRRPRRPRPSRPSIPTSRPRCSSRPSRSS